MFQAQFDPTQLDRQLDERRHRAAVRNELHAARAGRRPRHVVASMLRRIADAIEPTPHHRGSHAPS